jgi:glycosyltransferase involved in cell wall biosynthesis
VALAGEGPIRTELQDSARAAGITNIELPGFVEQPRQFLAGLHLYLQPSRSEGFCIAAHEAMVAGLPVLASSVGEMARTLVPGVTGLLVPPLDPVALAGALRHLLSHPESLHAMGMTARVHVLERFSNQRFIAAGDELFRRMSAATA